MDSGPWPRPLGGPGSGWSKCDWSPGLCLGLRSGPEAHTWEIPNAWCRCVPLTVQPASPDVTIDSGLFMAAGQEGDTATNQHSPWLPPPRAPGPGDGIQTQGRFNCGSTPVSKQITQKQQTYRDRGCINTLSTVLIQTLGHRSHSWLVDSHWFLFEFERSPKITTGCGSRPAWVQTLMPVCRTVTNYIRHNFKGTHTER